MQAMILAAGFGTRLRPYSLVRPKPLFPVLNRPLLLATIDRLKNAGFTRITVNCHHLAPQVVAALQGCDGVRIQEEAEILGTGGALRLALGHLEDEPLFVTNGDIYHDIDFTAVYGHHLESQADVTMVLHDCPRFNTVAVAGDRVVGFDGGTGNPSCRAFTGLQVINPDILTALPVATPACIIAYYRSLLQANHGIGHYLAVDSHWTDMGTPGDYLELHGALLTGAFPRWPELGCRSDAPVLIDRQAQCGAGCRFEQWACVGRAQLGPGVRVTRSVIWDGAVVAGHRGLSDRIVVSGPE